jgi:hypothetical protein
LRKPLRPRFALVALLAPWAAVSSCESRPLLAGSSDAASTGIDVAASETASVSGTDSTPSDGDPCGPYKGGVGIISESRLPAGACDAAASCSIDTRVDDCGLLRQWRCECQAGTWACTLVGQGKLDCGPSRDAGASDAVVTSPDAAFCCPRDTALSSCMHLGGVNAAGCFLTCDFWCATNWRVETDKYGCERWAMDYRMPAPGEDLECVPEGDGGPND